MTGMLPLQKSIILNYKFVHIFRQPTKSQKNLPPGISCPNHSPPQSQVLAHHSEPELRMDGFEMNLGNDDYPSPVPHVG